MFHGMIGLVNVAFRGICSGVGDKGVLGRPSLFGGAVVSVRHRRVSNDPGASSVVKVAQRV